MIELRDSYRGKDGRMVHGALIISSKSRFVWNCTCNPADEHDHQFAMLGIEERLLALDEKRDEYATIQINGPPTRRGLMVHRITACGVRIVGPHAYVGFIEWREWPVEDPEKWITKGVHLAVGHPKELPTANELLDRVLAKVTEASNQRAETLRLSRSRLLGHPDAK